MGPVSFTPFERQEGTPRTADETSREEAGQENGPIASSAAPSWRPPLWEQQRQPLQALPPTASLDLSASDTDQPSLKRPRHETPSSPTSPATGWLAREYSSAAARLTVLPQVSAPPQFSGPGVPLLERGSAPRDEGRRFSPYTPSQASASSPPKPMPTKQILKALPTIRDHTTDQLGPGGDEYLPREIDDAGEKKVAPNGALSGGREYRCRTFHVPNRGDKLFMLATECARVLGYRDSYLLFNKNRSLFKIIASQTEKDSLVSQEILPFSYRSRQIALVTARSMFRQFGSRVIMNGRRVRDDYWEMKARKQGFTEADMAGEKRPGASKAREMAAAAERSGYLPGGPQGEIVYSFNPGQSLDAPRPHPKQQDYPGYPQDFTEGDLAGERRPDAGKAREAAPAAAEQGLAHLSSWRRLGEAPIDLGMTEPIDTLMLDTPIVVVDTHPSSASTSATHHWHESHLTSSTFPTRSYGENLFRDLHDSHKIDMSWLEEQYKSKTLSDPLPDSYYGSIHGKQSPEAIFAHALARWSNAKDNGAQLGVLESLGKHRPATSPKAVSVGSKWQGWLRCEWELPSVVRQLLESQTGSIRSLLRNFVTITGSRSDMECSTCAQFLKKEWGEPGEKALEHLIQAATLLQHDSANSSAIYSAFHNMESHVTDTHIIIEVGEDEPDAQIFIDAIIWICAAVRINPERELEPGRRSQLHISKATQLFYFTGQYSRSAALVYGLEPLTECSEEDIGPQVKCWTRLFNSGVVAFYPLEKPRGTGLKISFDMMVHLSAVENVYHIDGGIILIGFFTALVPISYDEDTNAVQWHFEEVSESSGGSLKPSLLPSIRGSWYKTQDINVLRLAKCFLGWFARANILLGTRQLVLDSPKILKWSTETREHHQSARREGFEAAGQLGFTAGPINTNFQLVSTWRFHSNVQHFHRHDQYSTALRLGRGDVAVIIDSQSKQIWLVPMLSVVLHLCHRYFQEVNHDHQTNNPLPFADPSPDGASEAARVLESSGDFLVFGSAGDPDAENLRQLFLRINTNLLNAAGTREPSNKKTLFASELMAMITEPGRGSPLKKMKAPADAESWVGLLERVDFVGVCSNIGHLIQPEPPSRNPCTCSVLPSDRYFLAAHMRCLDVLSKRAGVGISNSMNKVCQLGETVFWNADKAYWTSCPAGIHDPIWNEKDKILQQISSKEKGKGKSVSGLNVQAVPPRDLPEDGAVVFGGDLSRRIIPSWRLSEYIL